MSYLSTRVFGRAMTAVLLAVVAGGQPARAVDEAAPTKIVLHPAASPHPALEHRLLPPLKDRIPGNAAVYYGKVKSEQNAFFGNQEQWEKIVEALEAPLDDELRREAPPSGSDTIIYFLEQGARCDICDWQLPVRRERFYEILLPEAQESRQFARLLNLKARVAIAQGDFPTALKHLQTSYALGRHVAEGETLVNGLVGLAICGLSSAQVRELIQQPEAPNLYWALTNLPQPIIDFRDAVEAELAAAEMAVPALRELDRTDRTPDQWRATLLELWKAIHMYSDTPKWKQSPEFLLARCLRSYPQAKERLVERGMDQATVEQMPVAQVILQDAMHLHRELSDEMAKWFSLSYPESHEGMSTAYRKAGELWSRDPEMLPLSQTFSPVLEGCRSAAVRADRDIAALRVLEALRMYAAEHEGRLPEKLSDVTEAPMPADPVTGEPFAYRREGAGAMLESLEMGSHPLRYEIEMRPSR